MLNKDRKSAGPYFRPN